MTRKTASLLSLIGRLTTWKVTRWAVNSDGMDDWEDDRQETSVEHGANVVSSLINPGWMNPFWSEGDAPDPRYHALLLDIDRPAFLVPSSTPGHSHLYIESSIREDDYFNLLDTLAKCGIIERGYANASRNKGGTFLRLPWVKKGQAA